MIFLLELKFKDLYVVVVAAAVGPIFRSAGSPDETLVLQLGLKALVDH
jgi:hypothetical protein